MSPQVNCTSGKKNVPYACVNLDEHGESAIFTFIVLTLGTGSIYFQSIQTVSELGRRDWHTPSSTVAYSSRFKLNYITPLTNSVIFLLITLVTFSLLTGLNSMPLQKCYHITMGGSGKRWKCP